MDGLFEVKSTLVSEGGFTQTVRLNQAHRIFEGHFPGQPVLPGVCSLAIVKKGVEEVLGRKLRYFKIKECKFMRAIDPRVEEDITFVCAFKETEEGVEIKCTMNAGEILALKLRACLINN